jgi:uncharacterized membrane protein
MAVQLPMLEREAAMADRRDGRERQLERLENLTDAVVAIAATLLVFPLVNIADDITLTGIGSLWHQQSTSLFVFVLSFVVVYRFWLVRHRLHERTFEVNGAMIGLNCAWLVTIVFLPFPTQLIGSANTTRPVAYGLYVGTMLATMVIGAAELWVLSHPRTLAALVPALVPATAMAVALVVAVTVPAIGLWSLTLLLPTGIIADRLGRRLRPSA